MATNPRAAAERLRETVGPRLKAAHLQCTDDVDVMTLVRWALPLLDETPIDEAFADSISMRQQSDAGNVWVLGMADIGRTLVLLQMQNDAGTFFVLCFGTTKLQMVATRGQLRRLASALGIELQEGSDS